MRILKLTFKEYQQILLNLIYFVAFLLLTSETLLKVKMYPLNKYIHYSERAKAFWEKEDVDDVFNVIFGYLDHLKGVLKKNTATDKGWTLSVFHDNDQSSIPRFLCSRLRVFPSEYIQILKLLEALDCSGSASNQKSSVVQVVIGSGKRISYTPAPKFFKSVLRFKTRCCYVQVTSWQMSTPSPAPVPPLLPSPRLPPMGSVALQRPLLTERSFCPL